MIGGYAKLVKSRRECLCVHVYKCILMCVIILDLPIIIGATRDDFLWLNLSNPLIAPSKCPLIRYVRLTLHRLFWKN